MSDETRSSIPIPAAGRAYLGTVILFGITVVVASVIEVHRQPLGYQWYMLAALTLVSGSATVQLPSIPASISISETFVIASVLLFGPAAGTVMVALDGLVISFWMAKRRPEWYRAVFNMAAPAASIWAAAHLLFLLANVEPLSHQPASVDNLLIPLIAFATLYFGLNSWLIAIAVSFETRTKPYTIWRENFLWLSLNYFSGASVALLLVVYTRDVDLRFIGVIVPLLLVLYFTFKTSMQRVEDTNRHLQQLNRLHVSTIETLAMAIDAKDQITHGHIRRVQILAVRLAERVGVADSLLIKAIEAAALLHDMGKLAIPEYILNKPGKLTPAEFERMKLHAAVGADILGAIDFPYPVSPIVRYHHENWDGTGYPEGLKGVDIPVGARILAVVDCYDALTSDRPYRPRLSDHDAIAILKERRGSMYDPLIVDTFVREYKQLAPDIRNTDAVQAFGEIPTFLVPPVAPPAALDDITAGADEMLTLFELSSSLTAQTNLSEVGDVAAKHLKRLIPFSLFIVYLYEAETNELEARYSIGESASVVRGLRMEVGQHLSGWVAANRQSILNSDPILDFGDVGRHLNPRMRSCLSCSLTSEDQLIGVLSLYSDIKDCFSEDHRRILEAISLQVSHSFKRVSESFVAQSGSAKQLPGVVGLDQLVDERLRYDDNAALLVVTVLNIEELFSHGGSVVDDVVQYVAKHIKSALRVNDMLFRYERDLFVAFLNPANEEARSAIRARIGESLRLDPFASRTGDAVAVHTSVKTIGVPHNQQQLRDALRAARSVHIANSDITPRSVIH